MHHTKKEKAYLQINCLQLLMGQLLTLQKKDYLQIDYLHCLRDSCITKIKLQFVEEKLTLLTLRLYKNRRKREHDTALQNKSGA